jgi:hypothetical protein
MAEDNFATSVFSITPVELTVVTTTTRSRLMTQHTQDFTLPDRRKIPTQASDFALTAIERWEPK